MGALFYLDPPYHGTEKYYNCSFGINEHKALCDILKNIKGKFVLSYNADEFICELYKDFNIEFISRKNNLSADKGKEFNEVIIRNFDN